MAASRVTDGCSICRFSREIANSFVTDGTSAALDRNLLFLRACWTKRLPNPAPYDRRTKNMQDIQDRARIRSDARNISNGDLLDERELAARWRKSPRTLQRWRGSGTGPPWLRIGGSIFYRVSDVLAFEDGARRGGTGR